MKFTIVCHDLSSMQGEIFGHPHLRVIRLNMTCGLQMIISVPPPPYYEKKIRGQIWDAWGSLLKLRNITHFSLWEKFTSYFPNLTIIEISNDLIPDNYRKVDEHGGSISIQSFVVMIFGTCILILN